METTAPALLEEQNQIIRKPIEIFKEAPEVLAKNQNRTAKALAVGNNILLAWQVAWNIQDTEYRLEQMKAAYDRSNTYMVNCANALKEEKEVRAAITQMMDNFRSMFTESENAIDKSKANSVPAQVQNFMNSYATEVSKMQEQKRLEAERIANYNKLKIEFQSKIENSLFDLLISFETTQKTKVYKSFNEITLETYAAKSEGLKAMPEEYPFSHWTSIPTLLNIANPGLTPEDYTSLMNEVLETSQGASAPKLRKFAAEYSASMKSIKDELIEKLPSKLNELQEAKRIADEAAAAAAKAAEEERIRQEQIANASAAEKARLEEESRLAKIAEDARLAELKAAQEKAEADRIAREQADQRKLEEENRIAKEKAEQEAEIKKQGDLTMNLFEQEAATVTDVDAPAMKKEYEIAVTHQAGYVQIFQFWFENEGKNLPLDKIENTKIAQMVTYCEKQATKNETKIESKFITYTLTAKALAKKAK